jgi:regulator of replication initiation timing
MSDNGSSARELREKYQKLFAENGRLREEIRQLQARLRDESSPAPAPCALKAPTWRMN